MRLRLLVIVCLALGALALLAFAPGTPLRFDVALGGGTAMTLVVDADEPARSKISEDAQYLQHDAASRGMRSTATRVGDSLEVTSEASQPAVIAWVGDLVGYDGSYEHVESAGQVHRFELSQPRRQAILDRAVQQTIDRVERFAADRCLEWSRVEHLGDGRLAVELPTVDLHGSECAPDRG